MQTSKIFDTKTYKDIEKKVKDFLNQEEGFPTPRTANSPRAVGDAIENILADGFGEILGGLAKEYFSQFARRAMADLAFEDNDDFYYFVDVKTHRLDTELNSPNLTSVQRLSKLYEDDKNYFVILKVDYRIDGKKLTIDNVDFVPIEFLSWECLTLGALGWGQIQIANANKIEILPKNKRKDWMMEMCDNLLDFYPKEILKINERVDYFAGVKEYWKGKQ